MLLWAKPHYFCEIQFLFNTFGELFYFLTCSFLKKIVVETSDMLWNFPHDNYHYQHKKKQSSFNIPCTPPPLEGGWGIWTFPGWWRIWTRTAFPLNECVYPLMWKCINVESSLLWADGSEEEVHKNCTVANPALGWGHLKEGGGGEGCWSFKLINT